MCLTTASARLATNQSTNSLRTPPSLLQILDVSSNLLVSLDGLPEACTKLHELYVADNRLKSLSGLARCAPNLETLVRVRCFVLCLAIEN